jgi:hypothetical protein
MIGFWLHYNHQCNLFCKFFSFLQFISYDLLVLSFRKMRVDSILNCFSLLENNICSCLYETALSTTLLFLLLIWMFRLVCAYFD